MFVTCIRDHLKRQRGHVHTFKQGERAGTADRHMIYNDDLKDDGQGPVTVRDGPTIQSTTETAKNDGTVKEMVIGVGSGHLRYMGSGPEFLGGVGMCISFRSPPIRS